MKKADKVTIEAEVVTRAGEMTLCIRPLSMNNIRILHVGTGDPNIWMSLQKELPGYYNNEEE